MILSKVISPGTVNKDHCAIGCCSDRICTRIIIFILLKVKIFHYLFILTQQAKSENYFYHTSNSTLNCISSFCLEQYVTHHFAFNPYSKDLLLFKKKHATFLYIEKRSFITRYSLTPVSGCLYFTQLRSLLQIAGRRTRKKQRKNIFCLNLE